jgi:hypothetical protein
MSNVCYIRIVLLWVVTQPLVVMSYCCFGTMYRHLQAPGIQFLTFDDGSNRLSCNVGKKVQLLVV